MTPASERRVPTFGDILGALVLGALWGAGLVSGTVLVVGLVGGDLGGAVFLTVLVFPIALFVWMIGLLVVGAPGWALLHLLGMTPRWMGAAFGGAATALVSLFPGNDLGLRYVDSGMACIDLAINAFAFGAMGAVVGWVIASAAYGRPRNAR